MKYLGRGLSRERQQPPRRRCRTQSHLASLDHPIGTRTGHCSPARRGQQEQQAARNGQNTSSSNAYTPIGRGTSGWPMPNRIILFGRLRGNGPLKSIADRKKVRSSRWLFGFRIVSFVRTRHSRRFSAAVTCRRRARTPGTVRTDGQSDCVVTTPWVHTPRNL